MNRRFDILIVGAGMAGLTVATLLAKSAQSKRLHIRVIDAGERPRFDENNDVSLRVSAIAAGSSRLYSSLGVWERVVAVRSCPFRAMRVWDASRNIESPATLRFDAAEFAVPELGSIAENVLIQDALLQVLQTTDVELSFQTSIKSLHAESDRFVVEFEDGRTALQELVIGADGAASLTRRHADIATMVRHYRQSAFVTHLLPEKPHGNTAWQRFLPSGPIALLPLHDGRVSAVWSTAKEQAEDAIELPDQVLGELLSEASDFVLGKLVPAGPRGVFPLKAQYATHYVKPGLALLGDAAHSIHPLAGQGANLGIADAAALSEAICEALGAAEHPGDRPALRRYERSRQGANWAMLQFVDALNRLFSSQSATLAALRGTGMMLFNRSGPIKKHTVDVALGVRDHLATP